MCVCACVRVGGQIKMMGAAKIVCDTCKNLCDFSFFMVGKGGGDPKIQLIGEGACPSKKNPDNININNAAGVEEAL